MEQTNLAVYTPSALSAPLNGLRAHLHSLASQNLETALAGAEDNYTEMEKRAIVALEEMKLINGIDLASLLMRGDIYKQIREEGLWSVHPEGFARLEDIARFVGISPSELSNTVDLCETIFPYMTDQLGINIAEVFENIGKSNFRELIPVMKIIITGDNSGRGSTQAAANALLNDVTATAQASGQEIDEDGMRRAAMSRLIENGGQMSNRELRSAIRPDRTPNINMVSIQSGDTRLITAEMTEDQWQMLNRITHGHCDTVEVSLPEDPYQRRARASQIPVFRRISSWVSE